MTGLLRHRPPGHLECGRLKVVLDVVRSMADYRGVASRALPCLCKWRGSDAERALAGHSGGALQGEDMAKALFGHVGGAPERRLLDEVTQLRAKVRTLEFEVTRLRAENDRLAAAEADELLRLPEPALT